MADKKINDIMTVRLTEKAGVDQETLDWINSVENKKLSAEVIKALKFYRRAKHEEGTERILLTVEREAEVAEVEKSKYGHNKGKKYKTKNSIRENMGDEKSPSPSSPTLSNDEHTASEELTVQSTHEEELYNIVGASVEISFGSTNTVESKIAAEQDPDESAPVRKNELEQAPPANTEDELYAAAAAGVGKQKVSPIMRALNTIPRKTGGGN